MNGHSPGNGPAPSEPFTSHVDGSFITVFNGSPTKSTHTSSSGVDAVLNGGDSRKMKQLLRGNAWPANHEVRKNLWLKLCHAKHKDTSTDIYKEVVKDVFGDAEHQHNVTMPCFVDISHMHRYHLSDHGVSVVKRIMCVIAHTNPDITFAPLCFALTSLFLHYMDEQDAYNCMYSLLRSNENYLSQTKIAYESSRYVLRDLARKYAKPFCSYISKHGMVVEGVFENWIWWIFQDLPFDYTVRVIDCFLFEGPKVLYRVALAVLNTYYKHSIRTMDSTNTRLGIAMSISQFCDDVPIPADRLMKKMKPDQKDLCGVAFGFRGLSRKSLKKLQLKNELYVRSLQHASVEQPQMHKSTSFDSLNLKVSSSFTMPLNSSIMDDGQWQQVWQWLPPRIALYTPHLLFSTADHGTSLRRFYMMVADHEPTLMVIKTSNNEVFGVYCSCDWSERLHNDRTMSYFGTGETFLFVVTPVCKRYQWVGVGRDKKVSNSEDLFMAGDNSKLVIGGGNGDAITIDEDMYKGTTGHCDTFNNEPLVPSKDFLVNCMETYGFQ